VGVVPGAGAAYGAAAYGTAVNNAAVAGYNNALPSDEGATQILPEQPYVGAAGVPVGGVGYPVGGVGLGGAAFRGGEAGGFEGDRGAAAFRGGEGGFRGGYGGGGFRGGVR